MEGKSTSRQFLFSRKDWLKARERSRANGKIITSILAVIAFWCYYLFVEIEDSVTFDFKWNLLYTFFYGIGVFIRSTAFFFKCKNCSVQNEVLHGKSCEKMYFNNVLQRNSTATGNERFFFKRYFFSCFCVSPVSNVVAYAPGIL